MAKSEPTISKGLAIIGSTGSIGTQALDFVASRPGEFRIDLLAAGSNVGLLAEQCARFRPALAVIADQSKLGRLRSLVEPLGVATASGVEALADAMERPGFDTVLTATVGYSGFEPTLRALAAGKRIALANKETLVAGGELIASMLGPSMLERVQPVDSEHSAIWQCLQGEDPASVRSLIITASGGPFLRHSLQQMESVTVADALRHPNWDMGAKITIDSATMVNKAFEVMEARWLFGMPGDKIRVAVHPQSIVHSMVEFADGAVKAQLGTPDMHLPIAYALGCTSRAAGCSAPLTLEAMASMTFELPDMQRFPSLALAWHCLERGGNTGAAFNAANEVANLAFRQGQIGFLDIHRVIEATMQRTAFVAAPGHDAIAATHAEATALAVDETRRLAKAPASAHAKFSEAVIR